MRYLIVLLGLLLVGCTHHDQTLEKRVEQFYLFYLNAIVSDNNQNPLNSSQISDYVAKDTLKRLKDIQGIYEQEIIDSDYFIYGQDYAKEWIPGLNVGQPVDFMDGKIIEVWVGIQEGKKQHLKNYLRMEDGEWKIYRVRSITDNYEQYIFDDKTIAEAKAYAAGIKQ